LAATNRAASVNANQNVCAGLGNGGLMHDPLTLVVRGHLPNKGATSSAYPKRGPFQ
jgi:hypothetical protein